MISISDERRNCGAIKNNVSVPHDVYYSCKHPKSIKSNAEIGEMHFGSSKGLLESYLAEFIWQQHFSGNDIFQQ